MGLEETFPILDDVELPSAKGGAARPKKSDLTPIQKENVGVVAVRDWKRLTIAPGCHCTVLPLRFRSLAIDRDAPRCARAKHALPWPVLRSFRH
jgi:hypothetical protein